MRVDGEVGEEVAPLVLLLAKPELPVLPDQQHSQALLVFVNANRKIRKRTDTAVAFTREYSKVSISTGNVK